MAQTRYTLDQIQAQALFIVDNQGLERLNMRTLASDLGTGPMTLYNYVVDRDALEELVVEAIIAAIELPERSGNWKRDVTNIATAIRNGLRAHPAAMPLVLTHPDHAMTSAVIEALTGALAQSGLSGVNLSAAFRAIYGYVMGMTQVELAETLAGESGHTATGTDGPLVRGCSRRTALTQASGRSSTHLSFCRGLEMLLDGIASRTSVS